MTAYVGWRRIVHLFLDGADAEPITPDEPTELNYGPQPRRILRPRTVGIRDYAGFSQLGMTQWFYSAFLPPPAVPRNTNTARAIGGIMGASTVGQPTSHIPSARVPRSIT